MTIDTNDKSSVPTAPAGASRYKSSGTGAGVSGAPRTYGAGGGSTGGYKGRSPMGAGGPSGRGGRPPIRRRVCRICMDRTGGVDWKAANFLRNFITERGKILSGRATGTCSRCQRQLTAAIKRARNMALIPTSPI